jgi:hypothetical protein
VFRILDVLSLGCIVFVEDKVCKDDAEGMFISSDGAYLLSGQ